MTHGAILAKVHAVTREMKQCERRGWWYERWVCSQCEARHCEQVARAYRQRKRLGDQGDWPVWVGGSETAPATPTNRTNKPVRDRPTGSGLHRFFSPALVERSTTSSGIGTGGEDARTELPYPRGATG